MGTNLFYIVLSYSLGVAFIFGYGIWVIRQTRKLEKRLSILGK